MEKDLIEQEKKTQKEEMNSKNNRSKASITQEERPLARTGMREGKESRPAISEAWKQLFRLEPQLLAPESVLYFDRNEYKVEIEYEGDSKGTYRLCV